jgi:hypothetical protein
MQPCASVTINLYTRLLLLTNLTWTRGPRPDCDPSVSLPQRDVKVEPLSLAPCHDIDLDVDVDVNLVPFSHAPPCARALGVPLELGLAKFLLLLIAEDCPGELLGVAVDLWGGLVSGMEVDSGEECEPVCEPVTCGCGTG